MHVSFTADSACYIVKYAPQLCILSCFLNDHRFERDSCLCESATHSEMIASLFNQLLFCINCCYQFFLFDFGGRGGWERGVGGGGKAKQFRSGDLFWVSKPPNQTDNSVPQKISQQCGLRPHLRYSSLRWLPDSSCCQSLACLLPSDASPHSRFHDWLRPSPLQLQVIIKMQAPGKGPLEPHTA